MATVAEFYWHRGVIRRHLLLYLQLQLQPFAAVISITNSSPGLSIAKPNTSNPQATFATVAGAKLLFYLQFSYLIYPE